ncbi:cytochrome c oxidase assembly factor [Hyphopichia burtonii NRRL Y-1933]|uniref:Cytochrome c oxidase assembly factor n=1 Tax=Hyphopichia burtonii NRRL Y-1933 TaxID=984485 RepID=A0A1E4RJV7_9ASCO|nr:cytochrome c oxidase assembly factor [Hyphopichia burtonii NRRL Y-1933]ODV67533.1 cytochrome c oxidase assembly factor [Hyphopichia burtonii NRRL Y-1933]
MSTASKVTFASSCLFAAGSFWFINYSQQAERDALRQGPIKDAARIQAKKEQEFNKKQKANDEEHKQQLLLKQQYESVQPLAPEIIRGEELEK